MRIILSILALVVCCISVFGEEDNNYNPLPVKLKERPLIYVRARIAKLLDGKDDSFCFIFDNHRQKKSFDIVSNNLYLVLEFEFKGLLAEGFKVPAMSKIIFTADVLSSNSYPKILKSPYAKLIWVIGNYSPRKELFEEQVNILRICSDAIIHLNPREKAKGKFQLVIAKLIDGRDLTFALIAVNDSKQEVEVPNFLSSSSKIKIKFPDGKIYSYWGMNKDSKIFKLKPGESKYIKFDVSKLLDKSNAYSLDNFNYGMSELIWEVTMPDNSLVKNNIFLLKTEKPLPEIAKTRGYLMKSDVPLK